MSASGRAGWTALAAIAVLASVAGASEIAPEGRLLVLPVQDRSGDSAAALAVDDALRRGLAGHGALVDPQAARSAARRFRMRNPDAADPRLLRDLGGELGADRILSATLHEALRGEVPRLSLSVRLVDANSAELLWAGFEAASGLDSHRVLGLGTLHELEPLAESVVRRLLAGSPLGTAGAARRRELSLAAASRLGRLAIVPFAGLAELEPTRSAEAITEATRAAAVAAGCSLVPTNVASRALRGGAFSWGEIDTGVRERLLAGGAETVLTGAVEVYEASGGPTPRPRVMLSMRLVDARTGRLLAARGVERDGWDRQRVFELGRVYSAGTLGKRATELLLEQILRQAAEGRAG